MKSLIIIIFSLIFLSSCDKTKKYRIQQNCEICKERNVTFEIESITIEDNKTILSMFAYLQNSTLGIPPPAQKDSYIIVDANSAKSYKLLNVIGIEVSPVRIDFKKEDKPRYFDLVFERLDDNVKSIHLISPSEDTKNGFESLDFMNVKLENNPNAKQIHLGKTKPSNEK